MLPRDLLFCCLYYIAVSECWFNPQYQQKKEAVEDVKSNVTEDEVHSVKCVNFCMFLLAVVRMVDLF